MQRKKKGLSILLAGTVALGALAVLPVGEIQAKAAISQQTKGSSLANTVTAAKQAATDTTAATTNQAIATQLVAKGIDYNKRVVNNIPSAKWNPHQALRYTHCLVLLNQKFHVLEQVIKLYSLLFFQFYTSHPLN